MSKDTKDSVPVSVPKRNLKKGEVGITVHDYIVDRYIEKLLKSRLTK